jgi:Type VI secretion system (T6SS), amidase effector protein 4
MLLAPVVQNAEGQKMKPALAKLWAAFPDHVHYPTLKDLYTMLGGTVAKNINSPGFGPTGNTCATRLSVAFNYSGVPITATIARAVGAATLTAGSGSLVIYRVAEFRLYLLRTLGKPTVDSTSPYDSSFRGKSGIIAFSMNWQGASGHIALWNGLSYREPLHDNYATYVNPTAPTIRTSRAEFWALS